MLFIPTSPGTKHCARPGPGAQCLSEEERWRKEKKAKKEQEPEPCRTHWVSETDRCLEYGILFLGIHSLGIQ